MVIHNLIIWETTEKPPLFHIKDRVPLRRAYGYGISILLYTVFTYSFIVSFSSNLSPSSYISWVGW